MNMDKIIQESMKSEKYVKDKNTRRITFTEWNMEVHLTKKTENNWSEI